MTTYNLRFSPMNVPSWLKHDDNVGNVYAVLSPKGHIGWVWYVPSSRSWVARHTDGSLPSYVIDCWSRKEAGQRIARAADDLADDAEERRERERLEIAQDGSVKHADIGQAIFIGTIDQTQSARLIRSLASTIADGVESDIRITVEHGRVRFDIGDSVTSATADITDSVVHLKG